MQSQSLSSVFAVIGKDQLVRIYEDGIYKAIDDFFFVIEVIDVAVLISFFLILLFYKYQKRDSSPLDIHLVSLIP